MHAKAAFVFWLTLILYITTLVFVTYVGVYLTYLAIPLIVISGLIMRSAKPSETYQGNSSKVKSAISEKLNATESVLTETNKILDGFNSSLEGYNKKTILIREKTEKLREEVRQLKLKKKKPEVHLKHAKDIEEKTKYQKIIAAIEIEITSLEEGVYDIEKECELIVARSLGSAKNV
jgi:cell shape-determining protein MreC